jgi:sensor histidine kinase YesM
MELVNNYLKLEKLRFKDALNYELHIADDVELDDVEVPPLLIQPLVENAIKHGLLPGTKTNNLLTINIYKHAGKLYIDIKDNGIGFNESQKKSGGIHKSTGIDNARKRIEKLSLMHGIHISLNIDELHDGTGAIIGTLAQVCIEE